MQWLLANAKDIEAAFEIALNHLRAVAHHDLPAGGRTQMRDIEASRPPKRRSAALRYEATLEKVFRGSGTVDFHVAHHDERGLFIR